MLVLERVSAVEHRVGPALMAGMECCLALWSARAPEREPLAPRARWIEAQMDRAAQQAAAELDAALEGWPLRALNAFYRIGAEDFEQGLELLGQEHPRSLACDLLLGSVSLRSGCEGNGEDPLAALEGGQLPAGRCKGTRALLARPEQTLARLLAVIEAFWRAGFCEVWQLQRETLAAQTLRLTAGAQEDPLGTVAGISPRAWLDPESDRLIFVGGQGTSVLDCGTLDALDIVPSLWLRRRVVLAYAPGRVGLAAGPSHPPATEICADRVARSLAVLGGRRRFEIARLCTSRARSTKELAGILEITEGCVSRQLKELASEGLLVGQRYGRYVTYAAVPEEFVLLSQQLTRLSCEPSPGPPPPRPTRRPGQRPRGGRRQAGLTGAGAGRERST